MTDCLRYQREVELNLYDAHTQRRYGFFVEGYHAGLIQAWEAVVLLRKLLLILILVALESAGPMLQGLVALWVCFFALLCQWHWQPYTRGQMNRLETLGLITSTMTLLGGVLWAAAEASETASVADAQEASVEGPVEACKSPSQSATACDVWVELDRLRRVCRRICRGWLWVWVRARRGMAVRAHLSRNARCVIFRLFSRVFVCVFVTFVTSSGIHLLGAYCAASGRFMKAKCKLWCEKRRNKREVRRMTAEEKSEVILRRCPSFSLSTRGERVQSAPFVCLKTHQSARTTGRDAAA